MAHTPNHNPAHVYGHTQAYPLNPVAFVSSGAATAGTTSIALPYPASPPAGGGLVIGVCNKYPANGPSTPTDFTAPSNNQGSGGSGASGVDAGSVYCTAYFKEATGSESGNETVTITSGNSAIARMSLFSKDADKAWSVACANGARNTASTSWSVTAGTNPGVQAGDVVLVYSAVNSNDAGAAPTGMTLTANSAVFTYVGQRAASSTGNGDDCAILMHEFRCTGGAATSAMTFTMTMGASGANFPAGASVFVRLRQA